MVLQVTRHLVPKSHFSNPVSQDQGSLLGPRLPGMVLHVQLIPLGQLGASREWKWYHTNTCVGYSVECAHRQISPWGCSCSLHLDFLPVEVLGFLSNQGSPVPLIIR